MEVVNILRELVSFNTIKDKENDKIINYIESEMKKLNFETERKEKYLIMSYGENPKFGFVGHTDTVEYIDGWKKISEYLWLVLFRVRWNIQKNY